MPAGIASPAVSLNYIIVFVADMNRSVAFSRDVLGLPLKFEPPGTLSIHLVF